MADSDSKSRSGCLPVFLFVALLVSGALNVLLLLALAGVNAGSVSRLPEFDEETVVEGNAAAKERIALISLDGLISSQVAGSVGSNMVEDLRLAFAQALRDEDVKGILFVVDSPGGEVTASDQIYHTVRQARERKPVLVWMNSVAASGGYYAACGGSYIMANETTLTGSIGVIIQTLNYEDLFGKIGLDSITFKSGKFKDMLSGSRPITPEEMEYVEGLVLEIYEKFLGVVAKERALDANAMRNGIADGRILSGATAKQEKLIDEVGGFDSAVAKVREMAKAPEASVVRYTPGFRLPSALRLLGQGKSGSSLEIKLPEELGPKLRPGQLYLLPSLMAP